MARVTVLNDSPEFLELVEAILEDDRYEVTTIDGDRTDAVDAILASRPDLLMIDLRLGSEGPRGWDFAQAVRADEGFARLPLLVCSADITAIEGVEQQVRSTPHVAILAKPFSVDQLTAAIDGLLAATGRDRPGP